MSIQFSLTPQLQAMQVLVATGKLADKQKRLVYCAAFFLLAATAFGQIKFAKMKEPTLSEGESVWTITVYKPPKGESRTMSDILDETKSKLVADGYNSQQIEALLQATKWSVRHRETGGISLATQRCVWNNDRVAYIRQWNSVMGSSFESAPLTALVTGNDYVSKIKYQSIDGNHLTTQFKVVPRNAAAEQNLTGGACMSLALSTLKFSQLFPEEKSTYQQEGENIIVKRVFHAGDNMYGIGIEAVFNSLTSEIKQFFVLAPQGGHYEEFTFQWGLMNGIPMPLQVEQNIKTGAGELIASQTWSRKNFDFPKSFKELRDFISKGSKVADCRFGYDAFATYAYNGVDLLSDNEVRKLSKKEKLSVNQEKVGLQPHRSLGVILAAFIGLMLLVWASFVAYIKLKPR